MAIFIVEGDLHGSEDNNYRNKVTELVQAGIQVILVEAGRTRYDTASGSLHGGWGSDVSRNINFNLLKSRLLKQKKKHQLNNTTSVKHNSVFSVLSDILKSLSTSLLVPHLCIFRHYVGNMIVNDDQTHFYCRHLNIYSQVSMVQNGLNSNIFQPTYPVDLYQSTIV